jgi:hypothetical protein
MIVDNPGFLDSLTPRRQPQCGVDRVKVRLLLLVYRFVPCLPSETRPHCG